MYTSGTVLFECLLNNIKLYLTGIVRIIYWITHSPPPNYHYTHTHTHTHQPSPQGVQGEYIKSTNTSRDWVRTPHHEHIVYTNTITPRTRSHHDHDHTTNAHTTSTNTLGARTDTPRVHHTHEHEYITDTRTPRAYHAHEHEHIRW